MRKGRAVHAAVPTAQRRNRGCAAAPFRRSDTAAAAVGVVLCLLTSCPPDLAAQCPDGTPPPCARPARQRVTAPAPAERARRFLILPFRNVSRSPELEWLIEGSTTMLGEVLSRWQDIAVVPDDRLYPSLRRNGLAPGTVLAPQSVRRVAEETGGWTAVAGEVLTTGGRTRVSARAYDVVTGRELVRAAEDVPLGGDVRAAFDRIGAALLRTAGREAASVDLGAMTTRSLDAYRAYLRGLSHANRAEYLRARDAFGEATRIDTMFAQAYYQLAYALLFSGPMAIFDSTSSLLRTVERVVALADRLPPRMRDVVLGYGAMMQGRFAAAYQLLEPLVRADSGNIDAIAWLSFLHYFDPIVVPDGQGGWRRRGSFNTNVRLAQRVLELHPARHDAYIPIVAVHTLAAGDLPMVVVAYAREAPSIAATFVSVPTRVFVPLLLGDTIELVPAESLSTLPPGAVPESRRRALDVARDWVTRWLAVGPTEGEAYRFAGKIAELGGDYELALAHAARAATLGSEFLAGGIEFWRVVLLGKAGRFDDAARQADALWATGRFTAVVPAPTDEFAGAIWSFNVFLMQGDVARADTLAAILARRMAGMGIGGAGSLADMLALRILSGAAVPPWFPATVPLEARIAVLDSLHRRRGAAPAGGRLGTAMPSLIQSLVAEAARDSALSARIAAAPWRTWARP